MPVEAIPYTFDSGPEAGTLSSVREERLKLISEDINKVLRAGEYVGHIVVDENSVIFLINKPLTKQI